MQSVSSWGAAEAQPSAPNYLPPCICHDCSAALTTEHPDRALPLPILHTACGSDQATPCSEPVAPQVQRKKAKLSSQICRPPQGLGILLLHTALGSKNLELHFVSQTLGLPAYILCFWLLQSECPTVTLWPPPKGLLKPLGWEAVSPFILSMPPFARFNLETGMGPT